MKTAKNFHATKVTEQPRQAHVIALDDDDRAVLGIASPHVEREIGDISHAELTRRYQVRCKLSFEDAQNRASVTLAKVKPARPKTVPNAVALSSHVAFAGGPKLPPITTLATQHKAEPMHTLTDFFMRSGGFTYEDAQCLAFRQLSEAGSLGQPADEAVAELVQEGLRTEDPAFNPDRDVEHMSEPARQQYTNVVAQLTALLQPEATPGRDAVIQKLGMHNLLNTLTAIVNGFLSNYSLCQTWAQRVVSSRTVNGPSSYAQANAQAKRLAAELAAARDKAPPPIGPGVVNPQVAQRSATRAPANPGPVTGTGLPVDASATAKALTPDIAASMRAMSRTDPLSDTWWKARALQDAARKRDPR